MDAVRVLFAELGFEIDEATLRAADARINEVARSMAALTSESSAVGQAVNAAARVAGSAFAEVATTVTQASDAIEKQFLDIEGMREAMAEARDEGMKAAQAGPSVVVSDDLKEEIAQMEAAAKATRDLAEEERKRRDAPAKRARDERADYEARQAFEASAAGKEHAAWMRARDAAEAAKKPVVGVLGLVERVKTRVTAAMGQMALAGIGALAALALGAAHSSVALAAQSEELREAAREARLTSSELQQFRHAGAQSGVGADRMAAGVAHLAQNLRSAEMRLGGNGVGGQLRRLGVDMRNGDRSVRSTSDIMDDLAVAFERVHSPVRRARIATQLFGESGRRMLDVLHTGPGGLRALRDEMERLGGGVTPEATAASEAYTRAQERLARAQESLRSVIAVSVLPVFTWAATKAAEWGGAMARLARGTHIVDVGLVALGATAVRIALATIGVWGPVVAPFALAAAKIAILGIAFDDLWTFIQGGDSLLGRFIDRYAGPGFSAQYARAVREEWSLLGDKIRAAANELAEFVGLTGDASDRERRADRAEGEILRDTREGEGLLARNERATRVREAILAGRTPDDADLTDLLRTLPDDRGAARPVRLARPRAEREAAPFVPAPIPMRSASGPVDVPFYVPPARAVPWQAPMLGGGTTVTSTTTIAPGAIVVSGAGNPDVVAERVFQRIERARAEQNDATHPTAGGDN